MTARIGAAQKSAGILGACLLAWSRADDDIDAQAGAFMIAETLLLIRGALTKR